MAMIVNELITKAQSNNLKINLDKVKQGLWSPHDFNEGVNREWFKHIAAIFHFDLHEVWTTIREYVVNGFTALIRIQKQVYQCEHAQYIVDTVVPFSTAIRDNELLKELGVTYINDDLYGNPSYRKGNRKSVLELSEIQQMFWEKSQKTDEITLKLFGNWNPKTGKPKGYLDELNPEQLIEQVAVEFVIDLNYRLIGGVRIGYCNPVNQTINAESEIKNLTLVYSHAKGVLIDPGVDKLSKKLFFDHIVSIYLTIMDIKNALDLASYINRVMVFAERNNNLDITYAIEPPGPALEYKLSGFTPICSFRKSANGTTYSLIGLASHYNVDDDKRAILYVLVDQSQSNMYIVKNLSHPKLLSDRLAITTSAFERMELPEWGEVYRISIVQWRLVAVTLSHAFPVYPTNPQLKDALTLPKVDEVTAI